MDPLVAAATLGVSPDAPPEDVRRAFRAMVRSAHPDATLDHPAITSPDADIDALTEARDTLLSQHALSETRPAEPSIGPRTADGGYSANRRASVPAHRAARSTAEPGRGVFGFVWAAVLGGVALLLVAVGTLAVLSIAGGDADDVVDDPNECVLVGQSGVRAVQCSAADAQQVVHEYSGARQCGSGSNTLVVGATTWCLRPVD